MNTSSKKAPTKELRRGWTTGACATAATRAAFGALLDEVFIDPIEIDLPGGQRPAFALAYEGRSKTHATAGIIKDAGDDPDVTHGALVIAEVCFGAPGSGVTFHAGSGVGMVTREGLPIPPGEPAINPVPRTMMIKVVETIAAERGVTADVAITISVPGGEVLAEKTWNPRLGIVGGISILGTTGIVKPYSCSAWIHSIHRGVDVARAAGLPHVAAATGKTSEAAVAAHYDLPDHALLDMGDFAGGVLKYLRRHPVPRVTIAGGFAKITKLAQGLLDLHSGRGEVDFSFLSDQLVALGANAKIAEQVRRANTAKQALDIAKRHDLQLASQVAEAARQVACKTLGEAPIDLDVMIFDREGHLVGEARAGGR